LARAKHTAKISVVLVEVKSPGNIGAIARVMKNFGFHDLRLVNCAPFADETYMLAMHARDVLEESRRFDTLKDATADLDFVAATSARSSDKENEFIRHAISPRKFAEIAIKSGAKIGIMLGREDYGLMLHELRIADFLITIPASPEYPVMNVSHALAIILYELYMSQRDTKPKRRECTAEEKERLIEQFVKVMKISGFPEYKWDKTEVMFRKMIARAMPTKWEYHRLMGVLSTIEKALKRK